MTQSRSYLFVFIGFFLSVLGTLLALNLALGERGLGSAEAVRQASAWQRATRGITYAPPVTHSRPFKASRLADRLPEINAMVLGASSLMGITESMFPVPMRAYNFSLTANGTAMVTAEAEYIERHHADRIRTLIIGLDWAIGMIYLPGDVPTLDLAPDALLSGYGAQSIPLSAKIADALSLPKVRNLGNALRAVWRSNQPLAAFQHVFFDVAGADYRCADGSIARDFDVVGRGTCLGFRDDGSWTFAGERHLSEGRARMLAQAAATNSSQFSKYLCSTRGEPNALLLSRLGKLARRYIDGGGHVVFIVPPLIPGMAHAMSEASATKNCLTRTQSSLDAWARKHAITVIDAAASEDFGCIAAEFLDENHAWPECHARVLARFWQDYARGTISSGLYRGTP